MTSINNTNCYSKKCCYNPNYRICNEAILNSGLVRTYESRQTQDFYKKITNLENRINKIQNNINYHPFIDKKNCLIACNILISTSKAYTWTNLCYRLSYMFQLVNLIGVYLNITEQLNTISIPFCYYCHGTKLIQKNLCMKGNLLDAQISFIESI